MSERTVLELFIEHQTKINDSNSKALEKLCETMQKIEIKSQRVDFLEKNVSDLKIGLEIHKNSIYELQRNSDFITDLKWLFRSLILMLVLGSITAIWQVVKKDNQLTKSDISEIIRMSKDNQKGTNR